MAPGYYVTVWDSETDRRAALAGPFAEHQAALDAVAYTRDEACKIDPRAHWYYFGTARVT